MSVRRNKRHASLVDAPPGACPKCNGTAGAYNSATEVVECAACGRPWPSDYWEAQT